MARERGTLTEAQNARIFDIWRKILNPYESRRVSIQIRLLHREARQKIVRRDLPFVWQRAV